MTTEATLIADLVSLAGEPRERKRAQLVGLYGEGFVRTLERAAEEKKEQWRREAAEAEKRAAQHKKRGKR